MAVQLREALRRVEEWEKHHAPGVPRPHIDHSAEDRIADSITAFAGSMKFVYLHAAWFGLWIVINAGILLAVGLGAWPFDPFPFGLLTMIVSLEAIFLSTFVMIAQNRQAEIADARAQADYETNVRAEAEVMKVLHLVESLVQHNILMAEDIDGVPAGDEKS
jgi:uncharacterized membrane protein